MTMMMIGGLGMGVGKVQAATCVVGPGVYCAAEQCGVWYQPPNNCSQISQKCNYVEPADVSYDDCKKPTGCEWDVDYGCQPLDTNPTGLCTICNDVTQVCTCTNAYGEAIACCYPCSDGSGCDSSTGDDDDGGGSSTCTPSVPDKPSLSSPGNGDSVAADGSSATVTLSWEAPNDWNSCNDTHLYDVYLEQDDTPGDGLLTDSSTLVSDCSGITATSCSVDLVAGQSTDAHR